MRKLKSFISHISLRFVGLFFAAFLGGMSAQMLMTFTPAWAETIWESYFSIRDPSTNNFGIQAFAQNGGTALKFLDKNGTERIQIGTYGPGPDQGNPLLALSDDKGKIRALLRLEGKYQSPTLVLKDSDSKVRFIVGLENELGEEPYMTTYDSSGQQTIRFNKLK